MYKPPKAEHDEPRDMPEISYPARRRKAPAANTQRKGAQKTHHTDEHPEIPVARRASLVRERQEQQEQAEQQEQDEQSLNARPSSVDAEKTETRPGSRSSRPSRPSHPSRPTQPSQSRQSTRPSRPSQPSQQTRASRPSHPHSERVASEYDTRPSRKVPAAPAAYDEKLSARGTSRGRADTSRRAAISARSTRPGRPAYIPRPARMSHSLRAQPRAFFTRKQVITGFSIVCLLALLVIPFAWRASQPGTTTLALQQSPLPASTQAPGISGKPPANTHALVIKPQDVDHPAPPVLAESAYLLDADSGNTLYAYNPFERLPMLSTTKLMTATLAFEQQGTHLDQRITINDTMWQEINQLSPDSALFGVKKGETYTLRDLLYGLLFVSGNDAAIAIADAVGGNLQHFVDEMNQKAQQLGMFDTHFVNPHGLLDPQQYSCAHDLALLGRFSMSIPGLHTISGQRAYHIPAGGNHPERFLLNENQFLWWYPGVDGGKTGYDNQSDFIQVMSVTRNHHHLIGVVMRTNNWWTDMRDLMNWGFDSFNWISPHEVDQQYSIPYDNLWNYFASDTQTTTIPTADHGRYYIYTGYSISGLIMAYFDAHGDLKTFGYPTSLLQTALPLEKQQFQHATIQCNLNTRQCQKL